MTEHKEPQVSVRAAAELAHLSLSEEEANRLAADLGQMMRFARALDQAPVEGVPVTVHAAALENVLRPDQVVPSAERKELLQNAPSAVEGYIAVPKTLV